MNVFWNSFLKKSVIFVSAILPLLITDVSAQTQLIHPTNTVWRYQTDLAAQQAAGTDWVNPAFDDSSWPEGRGLFGNDTGYPYPMHTTGSGLGAGLPMANYFRTHFTWSGQTHVSLTGTNYVDDGSIIYLNGVEIARFNMPADANAGTPDASAPVANPGGYPNVNGGEPVLVRLVIPLDSLTNGNSNPLVPGDNVIAVQVHQQGTGSSDRVFGLALYADDIIYDCFPDSTQLTNRVILETRSTTFTVVVNCLPAPTIQWYRDIGAGEEVLPGATAASYTLTNADPADTGLYYAKITTLSGTLMSRRAELRVDHFDTYPDLVSARLGANTLEIQAVVSELLCTNSAICGSSALDIFNWEIVNADNPADHLQPDSITMDGLSLRFTLDPATPWRVNTRYILRPFSSGGSTSIANLRGALMFASASAIISPLSAPSLSITQTTTNAVVTWNANSSWVLVSSTNVAGPYVPVIGAGAGSFNQPLSTPAAQFYKLNYLPQP